jgi:hypothetical protein
MAGSAMLTIIRHVDYDICLFCENCVFNEQQLPQYTAVIKDVSGHSQASLETASNTWRLR